MVITSNEREIALYNWIRDTVRYTKIVSIPGDASARRYFRVYVHDTTYIAVDAPPAFEKNQAFVSIAKTFLAAGLHVPKVIMANFEDGFLLLSDLGDTQLLKVLTPSNVDHYYTRAIQEIIKLQQCASDSWQWPLFDRSLLLTELNRFHEWYLIKHLNLELTATEMTMLVSIYDSLINAAVTQPQVVVHRDFHSRNLMVLPDNKLGILDFQDAVIGPITYDLVSLIKDCYIQWDITQMQCWTEYYWQIIDEHNQQACGSYHHFCEWADLMGVQRHLKVLGIFARLYLRDNKQAYLNDIPRILQYILIVCAQYHQLKPLEEFILKRVLSHESNDLGSRPWQTDASAHG